MPRQNDRAANSAGYDLASICLHWVSAAAIVILLFLGDSIAAGGAGARRIHTTVALACWVPLAARVAWRWARPHPPRSPDQPVWAFRLGAVVHHILLVAITLMLVSGPAAGLASGAGLFIGDIQVGGQSTRSPEIHAIARWLHSAGATTLAAGVLIHVAGVFKHALFDRDSTFSRMLRPGRAERIRPADPAERILPSGADT